MATAVHGDLLTATSLASTVARVDHDRDFAARHRAFREARRPSTALGPASSLRVVLECAVEPILGVLGFEADTWPAGERRARQPHHDERSAMRLLRRRTLTADEHRLPLLVVGWGTRLDPFWRDAFYAAQATGGRWAWLTNGTHLRLLDTSSTHARRWLQVDLDAAADDETVFAVLQVIAGHGSSLEQLVATSDAGAAAVCRSLRDGVLAASETVLGVVAASRQRRLALPADALEQALTVVYRVLFLLFAESRGLLPMWHPVYRSSYSIDALRRVAERGPADGMWDALRAIARLASAGCRTGQLSVTPFNGRLFDPQRVPFIERRDLDDEAARQAVLALSTRPSPERGGRERIAYRELGVEQLGAVYEALLDYQPVVREAHIRLEPGSGSRKASGSFYTPQPLARYLVRQTLAPLVDGRTPDEILALRVLDPSMGSGAFLVAACGFLAEAYEAALVTSGCCGAGDIDDAERARIRRTVAERCLFGVDLNPMAVQLGRLSLWLATLAGDRPLSFLDHHIRCGDSLLGAWIWQLREPPAGRRRSRQREMPALFDAGDFESAARSLLPARFALSGPSDTVEQVRSKEAALARLERHDSLLSRWKQVADLWCARWFGGSAAPPASAYGALTDHLLHGGGALPAHVAQPLLRQAAETAAGLRFFHWELEFPEVFFDAAGRRLPAAGFDAIIGNPPWDMVRGDAGAGSREAAASMVRFTRESGAYDASAQGQVNRYQLFVERGVSLLRTGGRCGLILPAGLLSDHGSAPVRRLMFSRAAVDGVIAFDNRRAIFPIHRSMRFVVLTATRGTATHEFGVRFGDTDAGVLDQADSGTPRWFTVRLGIDLLRRVSGDALSVPELQQPLDLAILERLTSLFPPLASASGWRAEFGRELNATDDRDILQPLAGDRQLTAGWPVIEGKLLHPFAVHAGAATASVRAADARGRVGPQVDRPRLAYRDVASATNRQTLIAAVLPAHTVSTHTVFCLRTPLPLRAQHLLCGLFNSWVLNYLVRQRVTTHVTTAVVERLPVPTAAMAPAAVRVIARLARQLAAGAHEGRQLEGRQHEPRVEGEQIERHVAPLVALNTQVARLYQLTRMEYVRVLDTFPRLPPALRTAALRDFDDGHR